MSISNCNVVDLKGCMSVEINFDYSRYFEWLDSNSDAVDITDYTFSGSIKDSLGGSEILALPTISDDQTTGLYIPDPTNGQIFLQIKKEQSALISAGDYPFRITRTYPNTDQDVFAEGEITFYERGF
tara:strand:+ start:255 stop:635 length:381 start_codon:yes stop_codon:yes gene_type:complete